jgi:hypothetical protein
MNKITRQIIDAIRTGVIFLEQQQKQHGKFEGIAFNSKNEIVASPTPFTTAVILTTLQHMSHQEWIDEATEKSIRQIARNATNYLISQKDETYFAWNYWEAGTLQRKKLPLDLDDTALAVASLHIWQPEYLDGAALANLVQTLLTAELAVGGPYNTWLVDTAKESIWRDCDTAVNANIAYMVSLLGIHLKNLDAYFEASIESATFSSAYYVSPIVILYFISRGYKGTKPELFISKIESLRDDRGIWNSPMPTGLALSALYNFGKDISTETKAIEYIISKQEKDSGSGFWPKEIFYFERRNPEGNLDDHWYHGADCITTSICIEALSHYLESNKSHTNNPDARTDMSTRAYTSEYEKVSSLFIANAGIISEEYARIARAWETKMAAHDWIRDSILLPYFLQDEITIPLTLSQAQIEQLCLANLCGWIGYTIIDDIIDGDAKNDMLPFVDFCLREMNIIFAQHFSAESLMYAKKVFAAIDQAYSNEQKARQQIINSPTENILPKSIGIAVVSFGILSDKKQQEAIVAFFTHFLTAKQNNDDAEDLIADLERGHISPVAERVLLAMNAPGRKTTPTYSLPDDKEKILSIFWNDVYPTLHQEMSDSLQKSLISIAELPLRDDNYFIRLVTKLQTAIRRTNDERRKVQDFLKAY